MSSRVPSTDGKLFAGQAAGEYQPEQTFGSLTGECSGEQATPTMAKEMEAIAEFEVGGKIVELGDEQCLLPEYRVADRLR